MATSIFVGNIPWSFGAEDVRVLFAAHGEVASVELVADLRTGTSRGYCFVEMPSDEQASTAIANLDGKPVQGRPLRVVPSRRPCLGATVELHEPISVASG